MPVETRSAKLKNGEPDSPTIRSDNNNETIMGQQTVVLQTPREPPKFDGKTPAKAVQWLQEYEAVASYYKHDKPCMLTEVQFALEDIAADWYSTVKKFL